MAGRIFGLVAVGLVVLVVAGAGDASDAGEPAPWVRVVKLALGVALLGLAYRGWRARSGERGEQPEPKWMGAVADVTAVKAAGLGARSRQPLDSLHDWMTANATAITAALMLVIERCSSATRSAHNEIFEPASESETKLAEIACRFTLSGTELHS